jgi:NADH:ubiquinone oxidoreductase subunit 4 (subunit M)
MSQIPAFLFSRYLFYLVIIPLIGTLIMIFINPEKQRLLKILALNFSALPFIGFLLVWGGFKKSIGTFQFVTKILWIPILNLNITLGIDGISLFFLLLTTLLIPLCILIGWNSVHSNVKGYLISFLLIEFSLIGVFCVLDLLMFYICFESVLIPMFLVMVFGVHEKEKC